MSKILTGIALAAAFAFPVFASAAVDITFLTVDGAANTTVDEGDSVTAKVTYEIDSSTDVESISWELVGSDLPMQCENVSDDITNGTHTSTFEIDTNGASEGTWDVRIRTFGDNGANASNLCETSDESDDETFGDRITVVDDTDDNQNGGNGGNGNNNNGGSQPSWLTAFQNALVNIQLQVACMGTGGTWTGSACTPKPVVVSGNAAKCAAIAPYLSAPSYTYSSLGTQLQSALLLDNPFSIPALQPGSTVPMGYRGNQTNAALNAYNSHYGCNN